MSRNIEKRVDNPWGLLSLKFSSQCCREKKAEVIMYDHTGALFAQCECGNQYGHSTNIRRFSNSQADYVYS